MSDPVALRAWRLYVEDMVSFIDKALVYVQGIDRAAFPLDSMRYDATLRNLELIGEAATHVQRRVPEALQRGVQQGGCTRTAKACANIACANILKLWPALWIFPTHDAVASTNNAAEQALRSLVLKRKISGPTRSLRGDQFLARGFSVHETCLRQGVDLWDFMHKAMYAFIANTTPPSLLPRRGTPTAVPTG